MIVVDTSALMSIALDEPDAGACAGLLEADEDLMISAGTVAEALIVANGRNVSGSMTRLIDGLGFTIVPVTLAAARRIAEAHRKWGKGRHLASLNFGDCFAYDLAQDLGCPLLYVGNDFARTDVRSAL